uniref:GDP-L-fucose synthase n=1 Tax=Spongospora subterranea TaxID=70186 RepID=A0A0H5R6C5_9EUKA|eukprot:CRZ09396.1 hypothetical protein [Spongospora subterranea]
MAVGNMKRVMVTGGSGMVGRAIAEEVASVCDGTEWVFIGSKDADLRSPDQTAALFDRVKPTHVIHLAAYVGGLFKNMKEKVEFWRYNVTINDNVLEQCKQHNVRALVSCLSTCIFPDKTTYPIDETMVHNGPPHHSNEGYAYAKRMLDVCSRAYNAEYGCNFTTVIPTNIYGKFDNFDLEDSHVIPGLIHKCYLAKKNNTPLCVSGSGKPLRQFIYANDLAKLILWTMDNYKQNSPLILSVDETADVSIANLVEMIVKAMEFKGEVVFDTSKSDGQYKKTASNAKLKSLLSKPFVFTPMSTGLETTVKWFVDNYDSCRK